MNIHQVSSASKLKAVRAFLRDHMDDETSPLFVFSPEMAQQAGIETSVLAIYDHGGILGVAHITCAFEDEKAAAEAGLAPGIIQSIHNSVRMLYNIAIRTDQQGRGYGAIMLKAAEDHARAQGASVLIGIAHGDLDRLVPFYETHGYQVLGFGEPIVMGFGDHVVVFPVEGTIVRWFRKELA